MSSKKLVIAALSMVVVAACSKEEARDEGTAEGAIRSTPAAAVSRDEAKALFTALDDNCAGNDNGFVSSFDPATFNAAQVMAALREEDRDANGSDCSDQREYSTSRETAVEMFNKQITDGFRIADCVNEYLSESQRERLKQMVSDPTNVGVFASIDAGGDNPEGCSYWHFDVFRADGLRVRIVFNHTD